MDLRLPAMTGVLTAEGTSVPAGIYVRLGGTAELPSATGLGEFLGTLHLEATRLAATRVEVDLRALTFMNSSCFKQLVTWIAKLEQLPEASQYRVVFRLNPALRWQHASLEALRCFAADHVEIELGAGSA